MKVKMYISNKDGNLIGIVQTSDGVLPNFIGKNTFSIERLVVTDHSYLEALNQQVRLSLLIDHEIHTVLLGRFTLGTEFKTLKTAFYVGNEFRVDEVEKATEESDHKHEYETQEENEHPYFTHKLVCEICGKVDNKFSVM